MFSARPIAVAFDADQPWLQQPIDTAESYALFQDYLMLGPARNLAHVKCRYDQSHLHSLAHSGYWAIRAEHYDRHIGRTMLEKRLRARANIADATIMWSHTLKDHAAMLTPRDGLRMLELIEKLERLDAGQATDRVETSSPYDLTLLSADELRALKKLQSKARA